jgi:outer membrane protein OmpA-like peptidoglycan-associated protein
VGTVLKNGDKVLSNSGDRVVVQDEGGELRVLKDDDALLRRPGDEVQTERFNDGSTRQIVQKPDGSRIVTIRSSNGTVLRRIRFDAFGNETILFDDLAEEREVVVQDLPQIIVQSFASQDLSEADLRAALIAQQRGDQQRSFSLRQVREINEVRALAPQIELDAARFASGSAAIAPEQARSLSRVGNTLRQLIADDPRTVFLIEGHTDAVGDASYNLALSDRRAETVALALTEYFDVPPENMITQGYGESALRVQTPLAEQANRRAVVRNITNLLRQVSN